MQIIYGFSNCTDSTYNKIVSERNSSVLRPDQKYHGLLIKGLEKNGATVKCLSGLPINRAVTKKKWIKFNDEQEGNAHYHYYKTFNFPILRQIMIFFGGLFNVLKIKKTEHTFALCDCLNISNFMGIKLGCKLKRIPIVAIVTDLPDMFVGNKIKKAINNSQLKGANGFIFLTQQMNDRVNKKNKRYIVLEGHVDSDIVSLPLSQKIEEVEGKKIVLYSGSIAREYGIANLVEGFIKADVEGSELRIFGDGDYREELLQIAQTNEKVKYLGVVENSLVVEEQQKASLLVNPRPSTPEFTKYSFPSKNMEYMVSGTPILTTVLPGMPKEYHSLVYLLEDESSSGICESLKEILTKSKEEREKKGTKAKEFVLKEKSNIKQAQRIMEFIKEV